MFAHKEEVGLIQSYNAALTKNESQKQYQLRLCPNTKNNFQIRQKLKFSSLS